MAGELERDPDAVGHHGQLVPGRALARWRATYRAVVLASKTMLSPSTTRAAAAAPIRDFSSRWSRSRTSNAGSGGWRSRRDRPAVGPDQARRALEHQQVLADRDRRDAELGGEVGDADAAGVDDQLAISSCARGRTRPHAAGCLTATCPDSNRRRSDHFETSVGCDCEHFACGDGRVKSDRNPPITPGLERQARLAYDDVHKQSQNP